MPLQIQREQANQDLLVMQDRFKERTERNKRQLRDIERENLSNESEDMDQNERLIHENVNESIEDALKNIESMLIKKLKKRSRDEEYTSNQEMENIDESKQYSKEVHYMIVVGFQNVRAVYPNKITYHQEKSGTNQE